MPVKYVKWLVGSYLPGPHQNNELQPTGCYPDKPAERILVLEHGSNPSTDYYITPRLLHEHLPTTIVDCSCEKPEKFEILPGTFVVIVRYLPRTWGACLLRHRDQLRGVAFFMDDDLIAAKNAVHLPLRYRHKIHSLFERQLDQLNSLCSQVWVSTASLANSYAHCAPRVVTPLPLTHDNTGLPLPRLTYFYHGSASHQAEIAWLHDVVSQVQSRSDRLNFMIIGNSEVNRLFKPLRRVMVVHPMAWDTYRHGLAALPHHIGLVPLLPDSFNQGRSHTKFFDLTRLGGVGIYSDTPPYNNFVKQGIDGILLKNDPNLWADTIIRLAEDETMRHEMLTQARRRVETMLQTTPGLLT